VSTAFNGPQANQFESYTFTITPNLPFPSCDGQSLGVEDAANVGWALQAICDSSACQEYDAVHHCDRNISQYDYTIQAHRQNWGSNANFDNCETVVVNHPPPSTG
jgi:hypothetical protein